MGRISAPEPAPAAIANFQILFPIQKAKDDSISSGFLPRPHPARVAEDWPVSVSPALGGRLRSIDGASAYLPDGAIAGDATPAPPAVRLLRFDLAAMGGIQPAEERRAAATPRGCEQWMPVPPAQAAERLLSFALADVRSAAVEPLPPSMARLNLAAGIIGMGSKAPGFCDSWMTVPPAQPAERFLDAAAASALPATTAIRYPSIESVQPEFSAMRDCPQSIAAPAAPEAGRVPGLSAASALPATVPVHLPSSRPLELAVEAVSDVPEACESWIIAPAAQPAERFLEIACASALPAAVPVRYPSIGRLPIPGTFVREVHETAPPLQPEPVAAAVWPVPANRHAAYYRPPFHLRFALHAIDEVAAKTPAAVQAPRPAGAIEGPLPMPVESMPATKSFEPVALPAASAPLLPSIGCLTAQVLPQARPVEGPAPAPVERLLSFGRVRIAPAWMSNALRLPTLEHFQPAADPSEPLASPAAGPGPQPVESMPAVATFRAVPLPAAPRVVTPAFVPELRAEFAYPAARLAGPKVAEPRHAAAVPAALDPLSRISAQPEGAYPERPKPAIPRPGLVALEYHCQRVAGSPAERLETLETRVPLVYQPFAVPPAHRRLRDANKKRVVLPFEQLFAKKNGNSKRVNISIVGKIAATIMVGLALWTGSRVANLSQHTEALRAEVAASERAVTAAEVRQANFGNGPVGKLRRAIADRAATEITDTFRAGMAAWGAEPKSVAAGWKRHPEGYVSVGDMALFQPSLQYTDYRMEFYGQIENKSMGWVVRAQDKKNYYAMKFKVIETGLRPMIAIVHYGVVNGKVGHKIETPLSVMIHNNQPYHVAVDVRGNRFTASIEGETVESWRDETLARGGVGFFAEAGEKARLYWMRLSRNQDWLGRVCAYMSGDGRAQQTAELWAPEIPHQKPEPVHPRGAELARAAAALDDANRPGRAKAAKQPRSETWNL